MATIRERHTAAISEHGPLREQTETAKLRTEIAELRTEIADLLTTKGLVDKTEADQLRACPPKPGLIGQR